MLEKIVVPYECSSANLPEVTQPVSGPTFPGQCTVPQPAGLPQNSPSQEAYRTGPAHYIGYLYPSARTRLRFSTSDISGALPTKKITDYRVANPLADDAKDLCKAYNEKLRPGHWVRWVIAPCVVTYFGDIPDSAHRNRTKRVSDAVCFAVGRDLLKSPTRQIPIPCSLK